MNTDVMNYLNNHLDYDAETGKLYWKLMNFNPYLNGKEAGHKTEKGYVRINFTTNKKAQRVRAHRYIWEKLKGPIPDGMQIDHINCVKEDNRIENLRLVTNQQNCLNKKQCGRPSRTGIKNVILMKDGRYLVRMSVNGKPTSFGIYDDIELAQVVAEEARRKYHGKYAFTELN